MLGEFVQDCRSSCDAMPVGYCALRGLKFNFVEKHDATITSFTTKKRVFLQLQRLS